jgi:Flp pilus assembly pilin Flp
VTRHTSTAAHHREVSERLTLGSESGQTTVEYAIVVTFVIVLAIAAFATLLPAFLSFFTTIAAQLASAAAGI